MVLLDLARRSAGQCELMDGFALFIQAILGVLAFGSLIIKRAQEPSPRPFVVWLFDISKQILSSLVLHFLNIFFSNTAVNTTVSNPETSNPCLYYLLHILLDCTVGVLFLYFVLKGVHYVTIDVMGMSDLRSGVYGTPPRIRAWVKQFLAFMLSWIIVKAILLHVLDLFQPLLVGFASWMLQPIIKAGEHHSKFQVIFVMLLFPLFMNTLQAWLVDMVIMAKSVPVFLRSGEGVRRNYMPGMSASSSLDFQDAHREEVEDADAETFVTFIPPDDSDISHPYADYSGSSYLPVMPSDASPKKGM